MLKVTLYSGKEMLVSPEDYNLAMSRNWYQGHDRYAKDSRGKYFHQYILGAAPMGMETDHINRDRLDNRRENLRFVTRSQNQRNKELRVDNASKIPGVSFNSNPRVMAWEARVYIKGKRLHLGTTRDFFEACCLRKSAELRYYA